MRKALAIALLAVAPLCAAKQKKAKAERPATQDPITQGCAYVYNIRASTDLWGKIITAFNATVQNKCDHAATITVTVGYFQDAQEQTDTALWSNTVAAGAEMRLHLEPDDYRVHAARIIEVTGL